MSSQRTGHPPVDPATRRQNRRLALILGGAVLFLFVTSFPFWQGIFRLVSGGGG